MRYIGTDLADREFIVAGKTIKATGFICIYAIGPEHGRPLKIGYAADLISRLSTIQCHNWHKLGIHTGCWVKELTAAKQLEKACHGFLKGRITGEWFDITVNDADKAMAEAAKSLGISPLMHDDMLSHVESYRTFVRYPNLFWPNARRVRDRKYERVA